MSNSRFNLVGCHKNDFSKHTKQKLFLTRFLGFLSEKHFKFIKTESFVAKYNFLIYYLQNKL